MSFLKNLFSKSTPNLPNIQFGRFNESFKKGFRYDTWDNALKHYQEQRYLQSFKNFFSYLENDNDNLRTTFEKETLYFEFYQGSKLIKGTANTQKIYAEAKIAKVSTANIGVYRMQLEQNFELKYSRYALDEEHNITITFSSLSVDASPYKLYYALKELALKADLADDLLTDKYEELSSINTHHTRSISAEEKNVKFEYIQTSIEKVNSTLASTLLDLQKHPGAVSYVYLDLLYRIDYLLKPEGYIMNLILNAHRTFFQNRILTLEPKNTFLKKQVDTIYKEREEDVFKELYEVKGTFSTTTASSEGSLRSFFESELENIAWYKNNGHSAIALAIPSYIVGHTLYNYSLPSPFRQLLKLYFEVSENEYFRALGLDGSFVKNDGKLDGRNIKKTIDKILDASENQFNYKKLKKSTLKFDTLLSFSETFLPYILALDFKRND